MNALTTHSVAAPEPAFLRREHVVGMGAALRSRNRWWIVVEQECRVLWRSQFFRVLLGLALLQPILRIPHLFLIEAVRRNPDGFVAQFLANVRTGSVDGWFMLDYLQVQLPFLYLLILFAGSGAVSNDYRNNLMPVYFSTPLSWREYLVGKISAMLLIGNLVVGVPGVALLFLHAFMAPSVTPASTLAWWMLGLGCMSILMVLPVTLVVLAASAWTRSQGLAAASVVGLNVMLYGIGKIVSSLAEEQGYMAISFQLTMNHIGELFFVSYRQIATVTWQLSMAYFGVVCAGATFLLLLRVRMLGRQS